MRRGDLYRVRRPSSDPKPSRVYVVASRPTLIESRFSSVICAPVFSTREGLSTQVDVGPSEGLKRDSAIHCDALMSIPKSALTDYVGSIGTESIAVFDQALRVALDLE